ncbi:hypothetical protein [uncultured Bilophila sp.]|uniref:hypothetical protein n=1 Tax=uncultured Bilophila sp. TaxID=529385 RepID=UPI0025F7794F|nr:hypothetical protein [uncultured Bilophila sp.]
MARGPSGISVCDDEGSVGFERAASREARPGLDLDVLAGQCFVRPTVLVVYVDFMLNVLLSGQSLTSDLDLDERRIG